MVRISKAFLLGTLAVCISAMLAFIGGWKMSSEFASASMPGLANMGELASTDEAGTADEKRKDVSVPLGVRDQVLVYWDVWDLVQREFYHTEPLDQRQMVYDSIKGMLQTLNDDYTSFQEPRAAQRIRESLQGSFEGIGALLVFQDSHVVIARPLRKSPALEAGLQSEDVIVAIDGEEVASFIEGLEEAEVLERVVDRIRGPEGSTVTLTIYRPADDETLDVEIERARVPLISVNWTMIEGEVAYIQITEFKDSTPGELEEALQELLPQNPTGVVLDLRHNPGGVLPASLEVLGYFYRGTALHQENSQGDSIELEAEVAPEDYRVFDLPMVVLIDERTASAAEIVAGALGERRPDTTLFGLTTFGKGSVQNVHHMRDDSSVRITVAHWFTPDHNEIHDVGIAPDYVVEPSQDEAFAVPCVGDQLPPEGQETCLDGQLVRGVQFLTEGTPPPAPEAVPADTP